VRRLRSYLALPGAERRLALRAIAALCWAAILLRAAGYRRARKWLDSVGARAGTVGADAAMVRRAAARAARTLPRVGCLAQACAAEWLLRRSGRACRLVLGVARPAAGLLDAHAWVECEGIVVAGAAAPGRYVSVAAPAP